MKRNTTELMLNAWQAKTMIPAFNIPYLPVMSPVVRALRDTNSFGLIDVARLEWIKFKSGSMAAIRDEYEKQKDEKFTRLHLDHIPVIDEDNLTVDYEAVIAEAISLGYESVMVDGSRLSLDENIAATKKIVDMAHEAGIPVEAELGAVVGHEAGPIPPYEELFASRKGFTSPEEAKRFVQETGVDWLSVAIGNIHGAISAAKKNEKKIAARLDIEQLDLIGEATKVPIVLHGGSGIPTSYVLEGVKHGIAKINIATDIRQPYESAMEESVELAQQRVYDATVNVIRNLHLEGSVDVINP